MLAEERLQQVLANNLANMQTPGFKPTDGSLLSFPQQLISRVNYGQSGGTPVGTMGTGVTMQEGVPLFMQGNLQKSSSGLDVGILDGTPQGTYALVTTGTNAAGAANAGAGAGANGAAGAAANAIAAQSAHGTIVAGANGRLSINGQPLAVVNENGTPVAGVYAAVNPKYKGGALYATDGMPNYDSAGQPSYVFVNAKNKVLGVPGQNGWTGMSVRIGSNIDMGYHSFFPVAYKSPYAAGLALTRDGHFSVNANHFLVDSSGHAILPIGPNGLPIQNGRIQINPNYQGQDIFKANGSPVIGQNGQPSFSVVDTNGNKIAGAKLGTVNVDVTKLTPLGQTEYEFGGTLTPTTVMAGLRPTNGQIRPGYLEQSAVNVTSTMAQMNALISLYQANANVLQAEDTTVGLAVSDIGKVP